MSDHDEQQPLTRRERRLRDLAETGALNLEEALMTPPTPPVREASAAEAFDASGAAEVSPFNEDGSPRSRREMRQLREAALAVQAESAPVGAALPADDHDAAAPVEAVDLTEAPDAPTEAPSQPEVTEPSSSTEILDGLVEAAKASSPGVDTGASEVPDFDTLMAPPTEPFSVEEVREAARSQGSDDISADDAAVSAEDLLSDAANGEAAGSGEAAEEPAEASDLTAPVKGKRRFPWKRGAKSTEEEQLSAPEQGEALSNVATPEPAVEAEPVVEVEPAVEAEPVVEVEPAVEPELVVEPEPVAPQDVVETEEPDLPAPASAGTATGMYSFPDIVPPEEWRSVFDDPASRNVPDQVAAAASGDFDDLISRAVAQESATGSSNTSALILPTMPEDTGGLTGPLGATGELYITGSIDLPKSLGETGGHSALHDSLTFEPIAMPEAAEPVLEMHDGPVPVSAKHAVSARMPSGMPVVAKPTKDHSKLPLILSLSGGGLLVVVVGLGVWGATNGFFSG